MNKQLKINIKNTQIAKAVNLDSLKEKLEKKKVGAKDQKKKTTKKKAVEKTKPKAELTEEKKPRRVRARSKSVFAKKEPEIEEVIEEEAAAVEKAPPEPVTEEVLIEPPKKVAPKPKTPKAVEKKPAKKEQEKKPLPPPPPEQTKLGPTGKHIKDFLPAKKEQEPKAAPKKEIPKKEKTFKETETLQKKGGKQPKFREFRDIKPGRRSRSRDNQALSETGEVTRWRKRRRTKVSKELSEELTVRPTELSVKLPISIKDLANEMKLKSAELITKLFMQGVVATLNDSLDDETTIQLLGHEFGCEITIDTSEEEKIRITSQTIREEIASVDPKQLESRAPVITFMGHVDHGKTSLIDRIRKSNVASGEAGAITQHIGAFKCHTAVGDITILDTPGHEAFSAMRARGADVTDIVVLVVAGDEGIKLQTIEAVQHARAANVIIVVAVNKCDKPNFNQENIYRQLAEQELLPEAWGGQTIAINCSAVTGEGVPELLEMLALQSEVLELKSNAKTRARGTVIESEMHKGFGAVASLLVQNGTLRLGDALVFQQHYARIKTMQDDKGHPLTEAPPSTPVEITGLSGIPEAGQEFIAVASEKEAREIAEARALGIRQIELQQRKALSLENLFQKAADTKKKILNIVLKADVQGSLEALKTALTKIESEKAETNIIFQGVGEINESDIQLAAASKAIIIGFHTKMEPHAEQLQKEYGVQVRIHDVIYHAIEETTNILQGLLDKVEKEEDQGVVEVKQIFKSSQLGIIAGCLVTEGMVTRNSYVRVMRKGEQVWKGSISSLKRIKDDVKEVKKGLECGIVLNGFKEIQEGDVLEIYSLIYVSQEL